MTESMKNVSDEKFDIKKFKDDFLNIDYISKFLDKELEDEFLDLFKDYTWHANKRTSHLFGNPGVTYELKIRGKTSVKSAIDWTNIPIFQTVKNKLEKYLNCKFDACAVQYYHDGSIGIAQHKDKEIAVTGAIVGLSLGATRIFRFCKDDKVIDIPLEGNSVYVVDGVTNYVWTHEIVRDPTITDFRYSLTFRKIK